MVDPYHKLPPEARLGDTPLEEGLAETIRALGRALDAALNGEAHRPDPEVGFVLLVFPFEGHEGRCNYISNARREDVRVLLREQLARFEGQPEMKGTA